MATDDVDKANGDRLSHLDVGQLAIQTKLLTANTSMYNDRPVPATAPILRRHAEVTHNHYSMCYIAVPPEARTVALSTTLFNDPAWPPVLLLNSTFNLVINTSAIPLQQPKSMYGYLRHLFPAQRHSTAASATQVCLGAEIRTTDTSLKNPYSRMAQEFIIVTDFIRSCIKIEKDYHYKLILQAITTFEDIED